MITTLAIIGIGALSSVVTIGACVSCRPRSTTRPKPDERDPLLGEAAPQSQGSLDAPQNKKEDSPVPEVAAALLEVVDPSDNVVHDSGLGSTEALSPNNHSRKASDGSVSHNASQQVSSSSTLATPEISQAAEAPIESQTQSQPQPHSKPPQSKAQVKEAIMKAFKSKGKKSPNNKKKSKGKDSRKRLV